MEVRHMSRLAALDCMCVCVFPDCPYVTPEALRFISNFPELWNLTLQVPASLLNGQDGQKDPGRWLRELPKSVYIVLITGELH